MPVSLRSATWFALRFGCVFTLFMLSWPWLERPYSSAACALGNLVAPDLGHTTFKLSTPAEGAEREADSSALLLLEVRGTGQRFGFPLHLRTLAFVPTVTLIALAVATPTVWRSRRGPRALAAAWLALHVYLVCAMSLGVRVLLANEPALPALSLTGISSTVLNLLFRAVASPSMPYVIPGLIWGAARLLTPEPPPRPAVEPIERRKRRRRSRRRLKAKAS